MKKMTLTLIICMFSALLSAPPDNRIAIASGDVLEPFERLVKAVGMVEGKCDTLAYNPDEKATGFFQIRPVRLDDYNKRTGSSYKLHDMYNYCIAEKVFLYYASQIGPYDIDKIAKSWNGSGPLTEIYLTKVKRHL